MAKKILGEKYFEGILQLRNPKDEVVEFIEQEIAKKEGVFISKVVDVRDGYDFYISSQRFLRTLGKHIHEHFGGEFKLSSSLHTRDRQTSRDLYRINIFIKLPKFIKGDVVKFKGDVFLVTGFSKRGISGTNLVDGRNVSFDFERRFDLLERFKTTVSRVYPSLEVIHPQTFDSVKAVVPPAYAKTFQIGEKVKVVVFGNSVFLVE